MSFESLITNFYRFKPGSPDKSKTVTKNKKHTDKAKK